MIRRSQTEERNYQEGRRDGFDHAPHPTKTSPAYNAGYRIGLLESLQNLTKTQRRIRQAIMDADREGRTLTDDNVTTYLSEFLPRRTTYSEILSALRVLGYNNRFHRLLGGFR